MEKNSIIRMKDFPTVWEKNCPDTLFDITIKFCISHPRTLFEYDGVSTEYKLRDGIALHREICHRMVELTSLEECSTPSIQEVIRFFNDPTRTRLTRVKLSYSNITDDEVEILCRHPLCDLQLYNCPKITSESLIHINMLKGSTLLSLDIGNTAILKPDYIEPSQQPMKPEFEEAYRKLTLRSYLIQAPKLCRLGLEKSIGAKQLPGLEISLNDMSNLTHLDLSRCDNVGDLSCLANHKNLVSLILFNVRNVQLCFPTIQTLKLLRHLDISSTMERHVYFDNPNQLLRTLVENINNLESLDISGTNLAGDRVQERTFPQDDTTHDPRFLGSRLKEARAGHRPTELEVTDIPGLIGRVRRPLEYLGLYNTAFNACYRQHIPAKRIGGEANEDQILVAAQMQVNRKEVILKILNDLFHVFRFSTCTDIPLALDIVMHAMEIHLSERHIQISGSASLFYIVKCEEREQFNFKTKRKVIKVLLDAMTEHVEDGTMLRNGCLSLIHFRIPDDVLFDYERLVTLLLQIVSSPGQEEFVQRVAVYLLNSLACQVDNSQKLLVGDAGAISIMLQVIKNRLVSQICDEVMETAWSTMWNVTDETSVNCQRFLEEDGMSLFLGCLEAFPGKPELLRNMMGLLGNVAEVKELRPRLMKSEYVSVFSELLSSKSDGIEVSYNAAGIMSHIASDGPQLWEQHNISTEIRQAGLDRMVEAIMSWSLDTKRNINYRSFEPILRLLSVDHTPEAQLWAAWALANLTNVYPEKYCTLLKDEGGVVLICKLMSHPNYHIQTFAKTILFQCEKYEKTKEEEVDHP